MKKQTITIGDKKFNLNTPKHIQRIKFFELLKKYGIDYERFSVLGMKASQQALTNEESIELTKIVSKFTNTEFPLELASIWYIEDGKKFSESYEENRELIMDWFLEEGDILEVSYSTFLTAMNPTNTTNQGKMGRK